MKKLFSDQAIQKINDAIQAAEKNTSGEIVPVVVAQSSSYLEVKLALAIATAMFGTLAALTQYHFLPWTLELWMILALQPAFLVTGFLLGNVDAVVRAIVPKGYLRGKAAKSAEAAFVSYGVTETVDRTGVLIYVSLLEHVAIVIGDKGIHQVVGDSFWRRETELLRDGFRDNVPETTLIEVVGEIGDKLAKHFPRKSTDKNELSDTVRFE